MKNLLAALCCAASCALYAEGLDQNTEKALNETLDILVSPEQRKQIIDADQKARAADDFALQVGGNEANKQKIYELAAKVMKDLAIKQNGDPQQMMKILEQGSKDPEGFARTFSPEQQKALKELAAEIERAKGSNPTVP